jgi:hypothetical protein
MEVYHIRWIQYPQPLHPHEPARSSNPQVAALGNQPIGSHSQSRSSHEKQAARSNALAQPSTTSITTQVQTLSPPLGHFLINLMLQFVAFAIAIAFGVYAIRSVRVEVLAVQQAQTANQLALVALCLTSSNMVSIFHLVSLLFLESRIS